jgi:hypothetical protein
MSTGNTPSQMKSNLAALPVANIVPAPNPNSGGTPIHGASAAPASPNTLANQYNLGCSATLTPAAADNWVGVWAYYALYDSQGYGTSLASLSGRSAAFGSINLPSISGPIPIVANGASSGIDFYMEYFGAYIPTGSAAATVNFAAASGTYGSPPTHIGYVESVWCCADSYSGVVGYEWQPGPWTFNGTTSYSMTSSTGFTTTSVVIGAFACVALAFSTLSFGTSYNKTQRDILNSFNAAMVGNWTGAMVVGDTSGALSETFTATNNDAGAYGAGGSIALIGAGTIPIGSTFHSAITSTSAISSAGNATTNLMPTGIFPAPTTSFQTSDFSYSTTNNTLTVKNAGTYIVTLCYNIPSGFGGGYVLGPVLYKNGSVYRRGTCMPITAALQQQCSTFQIYCNANDTLQPGYYTSYNLGSISTWAGEATGTCMYFDVCLSNRDIIS